MGDGDDGFDSGIRRQYGRLRSGAPAVQYHQPPALAEFGRFQTNARNDQQPIVKTPAAADSPQFNMVRGWPS